MTNWVARWLGLGPQDALEAWRVGLRSAWPVAALVVLVVVTAAGAALMYFRETALSRRARFALALARAAAAAVVLLALFRPVVEVTVRSPVRPTVVVLADESASMDIRDTRKDTAGLAEAGIALGKLPPDEPGLAQSVARAEDALEAAAVALESGADETVRAGQEQAIAALATVSSGIRQRAAPLPADLADRLHALMDRQERLGRSLTAGQTDAVGSAAAQREVAAELAAWHEETRNAAVELTDKLRAELALVSRRELVHAAFTNTGRPVLEKLERQADVRFFRFAETMEEAPEPWREPAARPASDARGTGATALGGAILSAVDRCQGLSISLVVALTDGANNSGPDPLEAARQLRKRGIRLVTVGVGLARPDDAALRNLVVPDVVFANDLVPLRVQCSSTGYEKRASALVARVDGMEVARKTVAFSGQAQFEELLFRAGSSGGAHALEVSLTPLPGEATTENNVLRQPLRVLNDKIRALYIEGTPRWEYRYIRAVLKRDPRIDVQFINTEGDKELARASNEHLSRFPEKEPEAFRYDLVILGDVKASVFTPTQFALLEQLIRERGASLIMLAGRKHAPAEYVDTPLSAMLPVRFDQDPWEPIGDEVYPALTAEGLRSTMMSLDRSEARTQALWANVKPLNWVPPVTGVKPSAVVLAELSDAPQRARAFPLVAWQRYGAGKVMFIGTDQLWRLRARAGDAYHLKFWGQAIQFLALSRLLGENRLARVETGRNEYAFGQPVELYASVLNEAYEPLISPSFTVHLTRLGGGEPVAVALKATPGLPGMYHGLYLPGAPGRYQVTSASDVPSGAPAGASGASGAAMAEFESKTETSEQIETAMDHDLLSKMARTTGGAYLSLREMPLLTGLAQERLASTRYTKEFEVWDNWLIPVIFVLLVSAEWAWRRNKNLA